MNIRHNSELALASMLTATLLTLWDYSSAAALIDTPVEPPMEENDDLVGRSAAAT